MLKLRVGVLRRASFLKNKDSAKTLWDFSYPFPSPKPLTPFTGSVQHPALGKISNDSPSSDAKQTVKQRLSKSKTKYWEHVGTLDDVLH